MSKDRYYKLVVSSNKYVASASLIYLYVNTIGDFDKQEIVTNIEFEAMIPSIKNNLFYQRMVDFFNRIEISDQKHQNNGVLRDENDKGKLLFTMKGFV